MLTNTNQHLPSHTHTVIFLVLLLDIPSKRHIHNSPLFYYLYISRLPGLGADDAMKYIFRTTDVNVEGVTKGEGGGGGTAIGGRVDESTNPFGRERIYVPMPSESDLLRLRACSPIIYATAGIVKAPVLMLVGGKDRRVPPSQGISYYHTLKSQGVITKMLVFPEDVHAIDRPTSEAEQWIAITDFIMAYL